MISVLDEDKGKRLDVFVSERTGLSRSQVQRLIESGHIRVSGRESKPNYRVRAGDSIEVYLPEKPTKGIVPEPIPIKILYRDRDIAVVEKPPGMVVYPAPGHESGTLMNALAYHIGLPDAPGGPLRAGIVHRLDKDTSGVMVIALTENSYKGLVRQFKERTIKKEYIALVWGSPKDKGVITSAIGRSISDRKKMSTRSRKAKEARTIWEVIERYGNASLLKIKLETGRTHQIRVHFSSDGHPVLGDRLYGKKTSIGEIRFQRQMLHASVLGFIHPIEGKYMEFKSPIPEDMRYIIEKLKGLSKK